MSIFRVENRQGNMVESLHQILIYITRADAVRNDYIYGSAVSYIGAYEEMMQVKQAYDQMDKKGYYHYILNPEKKDIFSEKQLFQVGKEVVELIRFFHGTYQVLMAIHFNEEQLHMHFVANNIDYMTGKRFDLNRKRLADLKTEINIILHKYEISLIRKSDNI